MKCGSCIFSRTIVSENGFHSICCLPDKDALECLKSGKFYVEHPNRSIVEDDLIVHVEHTPEMLGYDK